MSESKFSPCPFCDSKSVGVHLEYTPKKTLYGVICHWCGAKTPAVSVSAEIAIKRWNDRPGLKGEGL
jgi:transcription elongation factor Elf1